VCSVGHNLGYLFHKDLDNPDYRLMGEGRQIRRIEGDAEESLTLNGMSSPQVKRLTGEEEEVLISEQKRLRMVLAR
jgi:hypothetical protein